MHANAATPERSCASSILLYTLRTRRAYPSMIMSRGSRAIKAEAPI